MQHKKLILSAHIQNALRDYFGSEAEKIIQNPVEYCEPFAGGFSGRVPFKLKLNDKIYVIRELNTDIDNIVSTIQAEHRKLHNLNANQDDDLTLLTEKFRHLNDCERALNLVASENNLGPLIYNTNPLVLITDIGLGRSLNSNDCCNSEILAEITNAIARLHAIQGEINSLDAQKQLTTVGIDRAFFYYQLIKDKGDFNKSYLDPIYDKYLRMRDVMQIMEDKLNIPKVWTHGDLNGGNILYNANASHGKRVSLIDWTDGGLGNPYFDLSLYVLYMYDAKKDTCPDEKMIISILKNYEASKGQPEPSAELLMYFKMMIEFACAYRALDMMQKLISQDKDFDLNSAEVLNYKDFRKKVLNKEIDLGTPLGKALAIKCYLERFNCNPEVEKYINSTSKIANVAKLFSPITPTKA